MAWDSTQMGTGSQAITESVENEKVVSDLNFGEMGAAAAGFRLAPAGDATTVTWTLDSNLPANPLSRWFGLILPRLLGSDYDEGLARLKAKVEGGA